MGAKISSVAYSNYFLHQWEADYDMIICILHRSSDRSWRADGGQFERGASAASHVCNKLRCNHFSTKKLIWVANSTWKHISAFRDIWLETIYCIYDSLPPCTWTHSLHLDLVYHSHVKRECVSSDQSNMDAAVKSYTEWWLANYLVEMVHTDLESEGCKLQVGIIHHFALYIRHMARCPYLIAL